MGRVVLFLRGTRDAHVHDTAFSKSQSAAFGNGGLWGGFDRHAYAAVVYDDVFCCGAVGGSAL